jgi:hypothetical protein
MFGAAYGSSCIFNNMRVGDPDRGGGTVADRLPARSRSVPAVVRWSAVRSRLAPPTLPSENNNLNRDKTTQIRIYAVCRHSHFTAPNRFGGLRGGLPRLSRLSRTILRTLRQGGGKY